MVTKNKKTGKKIVRRIRAMGASFLDTASDILFTSRNESGIGLLETAAIWVGVAGVANSLKRDGSEGILFFDDAKQEAQALFAAGVGLTVIARIAESQLESDDEDEFEDEFEDETFDLDDIVAFADASKNERSKSKGKRQVVKSKGKARRN